MSRVIMISQHEICRVFVVGREASMDIDLKALRKASGKTQNQIAEEARIAERLYQDYEYGKREPRARKAVRIARAVNSTVEAIWGGGERLTQQLDGGAK